MMQSLTDAQSRILALLILAIAVSGALWLISAPWLATFSSQRDQIARLQTRIAASSRLAEQQDAMQRHLEAVQRQSPAVTYYVAGETPAIASAKLQQYVKQILDRFGGELVSTQILDDNVDDGNDAIRLKLHIKVGHEGSWQVLYALESGRPMLFVDNLSISARPVPVRSQGNRPALELDLQFDVTGYLVEGA